LLDVGAAPGGWSQVALELLSDATIVGVDILPITPITHKNYHLYKVISDSKRLYQRYLK